MSGPSLEGVSSAPPGSSAALPQALYHHPANAKTAGKACCIDALIPQCSGNLFADVPPTEVEPSGGARRVETAAARRGWSRYARLSARYSTSVEGNADAGDEGAAMWRLGSPDTAGGREHCAEPQKEGFPGSGTGVAPCGGGGAIGPSYHRHIHRLPLVRAAAGPYTGVIGTCLRLRRRLCAVCGTKPLREPSRCRRARGDSLQDRCAPLSQPARSG